MATISGTILNKANGQPLPNMKIEAWDSQGIFDRPADSFDTGADGRFKFSFSESALARLFLSRRPPKLYFKIYKEEEVIHSTEDTLLWDPIKDLTDARIEVEFAPPSEKMFTVSGIAQLADGTPLEGVKVVAYDKDIRRESEKEEQELGSSITDKDGRYKIEFSNNKFQLTPIMSRLTKDEPDLIVKVFKDDDQTPLVVSDLKISAARSETIRLTIPKKVYRGVSSYEQLNSRVEAFLGGKPLTDLKEDDKRQDINILAKKINSDSQHLRSLVKAKILAEETKVAPEFFFALSQHGISIDNLQTVISRRMPAIRRAVEEAIEANTLPESFRAKMAAFVEQLQTQAVKHVLQIETPPGRFSVGDLLATSSLDRPTQECLVAVALEHEVGTEDFWSQLAKTPEFGNGNQSKLAEARTTLQLGALTGYHLPLIQALQAELHNQGSLRDLAHLARLDEVRWEELVRQYGVPQEITGEDEDSRIGNYARALQRQVESAYPTAAIAARIKTSDWPHADALKSFFNTNPDFDLLADSVERTKNIDLTEPARSELKRIQRLARVTPHFKEIKGFMDAGIDSAGKISVMSYGAFTTRFGSIFDSEATALHAYHNATRRSQLTTHLRARYGSEQNHARFRDVPPSLHWPSLPSSVNLNIETLFGSQDMCKCEHCNSMLSPAAYLVDLLQFLKRETLTGQTVLFSAERRPDIEKIVLNCHNINTPMPYIDLVNEIFEQAVLNQDRLNAHQTTWTSDELAANPEHVVWKAYSSLKAKVFPWRLPFDLLEKEASVYLEHLGTCRHKLMALFHTGDPLADIHVAAAYLGITDKERRLLDGPGTFNDRDLWDLKQTNWLEVLTDPNEVLHRSGLALEELQEVLSLGFVNGWTQRPFLQIVYGRKCALADASVNLDEDRDAPARLCRFVRLWRKLGWTMTEMDTALHTFRPQGTVGEIPLMAISNLHRLKDRLKMALMEVLSFYTDLDQLPITDDQDADSTLFEAVFFDRKVTHPNNNEEFKGKFTSGEESLITGYLPQVTSALGVSADDVRLLLNWLPSHIDSEDEPRVTVTNVSHLYRVTRLCRATRLKVGEFIALVELTHIYPLIQVSDSPDLALRRTLDFLDALEHVNSSGFSVRELDQLLRHRATPESVATAIRENAVILQQLRNDLKLIAEELRIPKDADLVALSDFIRRNLSSILPTETVDLVLGWLQGDPAQQIPDSDPKPIWAAKVARLTALAKVHPELSFLKGGQPLETLPDDEKERAAILDERYREVLVGPRPQERRKDEQGLLQYLKKFLSRTLIIQQLAEVLALEPAVAEQLLENWVSTAGIEPEAFAIDDFQDLANDKPLSNLELSIPESLIQEAFPDQERVAVEAYPEAFETLTRLRKIALMLQRLQITYAEARYLFSRKKDCWLDLSSLPVKRTAPAASYTGWKRLVDVCQLRNRLGGSEPSLFDLFEIADNYKDHPIRLPIPVGQRHPYVSALLTRTNWNADDLKVLCTHFGYDMADFTEELALIRLERCFREARALGVTISEPWNLLEWITPALQTDAAASIKRAAKAKYADPDQWLAVARPLQDVLRESKRTALVDYLASKGNLTVDDLYERYLIDPEMSACMFTSRIKQTISSIQLFIQRIFLNLENVKFLDQVAAQVQWTWMKNYRVWEANRRIFLYPENWIVPELRDDKSPFFKELENELHQNEITSVFAEKVYLNYLKKLNEVSNLDIVAHCYGPDGKMHIFGRTRGTPHIYYYRYCDKYLVWSPWEFINIDIEGDHLMPVVWNNRLFLFWPVFIETPEKPVKQHITKITLKGPVRVKPQSGEEGNGSVGEVGDGVGSDNTDTTEEVVEVNSTVELKTYWIVQLGCSEYWQGIWNKAQEIKERLTPLCKVRYEENRAKQPWGYHEELLKKFTLPDEIDERIRKQFGGGEYDELVYINEDPAIMKLIAPTYANNKSLFDFSIDCHEDHIQINVFYPALITTMLHKPLSSSTNVRLEGEFLFEQTLNYDDEKMTCCGQFLIHPSQTSIQSGIDLEPDWLWKTKSFPKQATSLIGYGDPIYYGQLHSNKLTPLGLGSDPLWCSNKSQAEPQQFKFSFPIQEKLAFYIKFPILFFVSDSRRNFYVPWDTPQVHYHPFVSTFIDTLSVDGFDGLLKKNPSDSSFPELYRQRMVNPIFGDDAPLKSSRALYVNQPISYLGPHFEIKKPREDITLENQEAYSLYNWELFFHIPLLIADRLSKNQRFEEAMQWFHYIFDPLTPDTSDPFHWQRPWKFGRFFDNGDATRSIDELMMLLSKDSVSDMDYGFWHSALDTVKKRTPEAQIKESLERQIDSWRLDPFKPHLLARLRITPYMKTVMMKYLDNLLAWADQLFRRDTIETINEATQLYILAAQLLGPRPRELPEREHQERTYAELKDYLDAFSNALEDEIPDRPDASILELAPGYASYTLLDPGRSLLMAAQGFNSKSGSTYLINYLVISEGIIPRPTFTGMSVETPSAMLDSGIHIVDPNYAVEKIPPPPAPTLPPPGLYFCVPQNELLLGYWDKVADRLFKIRNCMNIEGMVRQPPLFQPVIDPALLVKAKAAGVDFSSVLNDLYAPAPNYRFNILAQKVSELCQEVKSLGASLLAALEKRDAEKLAMLRSEHEIQMLKMIRDVRKNQLDEANSSLENLLESQKVLELRSEHFTALIDQGLIEEEKAQLATIKSGTDKELDAQEADETARNWSYVPDIHCEATFFEGSLPGGAGGTPSPAFALNAGAVVTGSYGGSNYVRGHQLEASASRSDASRFYKFAETIGISGQYIRREEEWEHQLKIVKAETTQIQKQIEAAEFRKLIADQELTNHDQQVENAKVIDDHLRSKFTNEDLYDWMVGQISAVYFQSYQMAYDIAKQAEKAYRFELGLDESNYIQFGYWDNLKKGLLAGERLALDLKRLEASYLEKNKRDYEITKHISLMMLNPLQLLWLRETGTCEFDIPELVFDLDYPGHYMRRIKSVGLTIPCITGPYTGVNAKLTLLKNRIRRNTSIKPQYAWDAEDFNRDRFIHNLADISSIASSTAQNDHGMFEVNFRDERYLPFEGAGVISSWRLELPGEFRQFDYDTISDVILHISYTARDGGGGFKQTVNNHVKNSINKWLDEMKETEEGIPRLFSLKHEFPNAFHTLVGSPTNSAQVTNFEIKKQHFPYFVAYRALELADGKNVFIYLKPKDNKKIDSSNLVLNIKASGPGSNDETVEVIDGKWNDEKLNIKTGSVSISGDPRRLWTLDFGINGLTKDELEDIFILIYYNLS